MRPSDETELAEAIRGATGTLRICGGGTRDLRRPGGAVVEMGGIAGIVLYEPGALTLVARAGTPLAEVETALAAEGQRLAFEPPDLRGLLGREGVSTLGGVVSANASGPRRFQAGACRDSVIGLRFVDGRGVVVSNGGRVMKNVTGYDLVKLLCGAQGVLGAITEVSLKLQARPETEVTLVARGLADVAALALLRKAVGSPWEPTGAAHLAVEGEARTMLRIEGLAGSVAYRAGRIAGLLGGEWERVEGEASAALWREVRDVTPFAGRLGAVWRLSLVPGRAAEVPARLARAGISAEPIWDWGGGLLWLLVDNPFCAPEIRAAAEGIGHATLVRPLPGMEEVPVFPTEPSAVAALTGGIVRQFDPDGKFSAGRLG